MAKKTDKAEKRLQRYAVALHLNMHPESREMRRDLDFDYVGETSAMISHGNKQMQLAKSRRTGNWRVTREINR